MTSMHFLLVIQKSLAYPEKKIQRSLFLLQVPRCLFLFYCYYLGAFSFGLLQVPWCIFFSYCKYLDAFSFSISSTLMACKKIFYRLVVTLKDEDDDLVRGIEEDLFLRFVKRMSRTNQVLGSEAQIRTSYPTWKLNPWLGIVLNIMSPSGNPPRRRFSTFEIHS